MPVGPRIVPTAANNLTSPAPVAPTRCPGSISRRPTAKPPSAAAIDRSVRWVAARVIPTAVIPSVNQFGTRRTRKSMAALAPPLPATAAMTTALDGTGNNTGKRLPEHGVDRGPDRHDDGDRDDGDQRDEQAVLDKVLSLIAAEDQFVDQGNNGIHTGLAFRDGSTPARACLGRRGPTNATRRAQA